MRLLCKLNNRFFKQNKAETHSWFCGTILPKAQNFFIMLTMPQSLYINLYRPNSVANDTVILRLLATMGNTFPTTDERT